MCVLLLVEEHCIPLTSNMLQSSAENYCVVCKRRKIRTGGFYVVQNDFTSRDWVAQKNPKNPPTKPKPKQENHPKYFYKLFLGDLNDSCFPWYFKKYAHLVGYSTNVLYHWIHKSLLFSVLIILHWMDQLGSGICSHKFKCFSKVSELLVCLSCLSSRDKHLWMATLPISNHTLKELFLSIYPGQNLGCFDSQTSVILTDQTQRFLICMTVLRAYSPDLYVYEKSYIFSVFFTFSKSFPCQKALPPH